MSRCGFVPPPLPQLLLHAPLWSRFFADIVGGLGLGLSKVGDPIKEFGKSIICRKRESEPFILTSKDRMLQRYFVDLSIICSVSPLLPFGHT